MIYKAVCFLIPYSRIFAQTWRVKPQQVFVESCRSYAAKVSSVTMDKFVVRTRKDGTVVNPIPAPTTPTKAAAAKSRPKSPAKLATKSPAKSPSKEAGDGAESQVAIVPSAEYDPAKPKYHPINDACWRVGEKTPYIALAKTLETIAAESSSLAIVQIMANFLRSVMVLSKQDTVRCIYLCRNKLAPAWENVELGLGESLLLKALAEATGRSLQAVKKIKQEKGDLGEVAALSRLNQTTLMKSKALTVESVFNTFKDIAAHSGHQSQQQKVNKVKGMLVSCSDPSEARFVLRSLAGGLRIGLAEQNMLAAISLAATQTPPNQEYPPDIIDALGKDNTSKNESRMLAKQQMKTAFNLMPDYDTLMNYLLEGGMDAVANNCTIRPGIPVKPMLAKPTTGVQDVLESLGVDEDFVCEWKYDGERAQVHCTSDGVYHIYSRNLENHTEKFPDIIKILPQIADANVVSFILDSEVVAWDVEKKEILPFQVLTTRKRKREVEGVDVKVDVQVCIFAFDLLYFNGQSLIDKPLSERRELLRQHFNLIPGQFVLANGIVTHDPDAMQSFLNESVEGRCEGLMVKQLAATYQVAHRSNKWLKLKKDYIQGVGDSIDCVVMGAFYGTGKRTGVFGSYLLGVCDGEEGEEEYQTICKLSTGFSDEELAKFTKEMKPHIIDTPKSYYRIGGVVPDVWFDAVQVWEIKAADLSISPVHTAAYGRAHNTKGISLRFPRFIRVRDDKQPKDCTPASLVCEMFKKQAAFSDERKSTKKQAAGDSDSDGGY